MANTAGWLLDDTSVVYNAFLTQTGNAGYSLRNINTRTISRVTSSPSPYQGSGSYPSHYDNSGFQFEFGTGGTQVYYVSLYHDVYVYFPSTITGNVNNIILTLDFGNNFYAGASILANGSISIQTYDDVNGTVFHNTSAAGAVPNNQWVRIQTKNNSAGPQDIRVFKGSNINGTTPDVSISYNVEGIFGSGYLYPLIWFANQNNLDTIPFYVDSLLTSDTAYLSRYSVTPSSAQVTASASSTMTGGKVPAAATPTITDSAVSGAEKMTAYISNVSTGGGYQTWAGNNGGSYTGTVTLPNLVAGDVVVYISDVTVNGGGYFSSAPTATGLTFTQQINQSGSTSDKKLRIHTAVVSSPVTTPTISEIAYSFGGTASAISVFQTAIVIKNASGTPVGDKTSGSSIASSFYYGLTPLAASSLNIFAVYDGGVNGYASTPFTNTTATTQLYPINPVPSSSGYAGWSANAIVGGSQIPTFSASGTNSVYAGIEIKAAVSGSYNISGTGSETTSGSATASNSIAVSSTASETSSAVSSIQLQKTLSETFSVAPSGSSSISYNATSSATGSISVGSSANATVTSTAKTIDINGQITSSGVLSIRATYPNSVTSSVTASASVDITKPTSQTISAVASVVVVGLASVNGNAVYYLLNPIVEEGLVEYDPYYNLIRNNVGVTVVKRDGTWQSVRNKVDGWLQECDVVFRGGYENQVNATQKAELEAAGYTVETRYL